MAISAKLKYLRIPARKVRLVANLIRRKPAEEARAILSFTTKKASKPLLKLLDSSLANAKDVLKKDAVDLYVSKITVDEGPMQRRFFPRSRGRAFLIQKKSSHITIVLDEKDKAPKARETKKKRKAVKKNK